MKVLRLNTYFHLPDDFEGGLNEALEELVAYRRTRGENTPRPAKMPRPFDEMTRDEQWDYFLESIKEGFRLVGSACCVETDERGEWQPLEDER